MPLANGLKRVGLVMLLCLAAWRAGVSAEPVIPVDPYDPAYLAAPLLDGVPFDDGVTMPLPSRYRDGQTLLMAGDFQQFFNNECINQHFDRKMWACSPDHMAGGGKEPYRVIYGHPYFIVFMAKYADPDNVQRTMAYILSFAIYGPPHYLKQVYTLRFDDIGDAAVYDWPAMDIVRHMQSSWSMPVLVDGYLKQEGRSDLGSWIAWHRDTAGEDAMLAPLSCRQDMDVPCFRAGCDRFPDLCGFAWEMKEKLDLDFEDRNSILRQLGKHGTK